MLGVATLTLGSSAALSIQTQTQNATTSASGKKLAIPCCRSRRNYYNGAESLPMGLVSYGNSHCSLFCSFKESPAARLSFTTAVSTVHSDQLSSSDPPSKNEANKYYFVVADAKFMLDEEEHFQEQLFKRRRYYAERNKDQDFWLVIEPKFLDQFPNITKRLSRPAVALVSTNGPWITFMKLRLDRVLSESFEADNLEGALASNPVNLEFEKLEKWVAPYPKYEFGWWEPFLPPAAEEVKV